MVVSVDINRRMVGYRGKPRVFREAKSLLASLGLHVVSWSDELSGGVTDAWHIFGFGSGLQSPVMPRARPNLSRSLAHYLDGGVCGHFPRVETSSLPVVSDPVPPKSRHVVWHNGAVMPEGLLPCHTPDALVYCPTHFSRAQLVRRQLTRLELLRVFQVPSDFDSFFSSYPLDEGALPFEWVPSQDIYADILRQLWKSTGGGGTCCDKPSKQGGVAVPEALPQADGGSNNHSLEVKECGGGSDGDGLSVSSPVTYPSYIAFISSSRPSVSFNGHTRVIYASGLCQSRSSNINDDRQSLTILYLVPRATRRGLHLRYTITHPYQVWIPVLSVM